MSAMMSVADGRRALMIEVMSAVVPGRWGAGAVMSAVVGVVVMLGGAPAR
jgi:hypothetical protein